MTVGKSAKVETLEPQNSATFDLLAPILVSFDSARQELQNELSHGPDTAAQGHVALLRDTRDTRMSRFHDHPAASPHGGAHGYPGFSGFPEAINPGNRRCSRRNRYQSTQLVETKRFMYHTPGTELRRVICDLAKSRIFRISGTISSGNRKRTRRNRYQSTWHAERKRLVYHTPDPSPDGDTCPFT
ncbi:hypothetical protein DdX_14794 [Ditylenchus destructor]|uniref:Uncharacterized protein n=1 Tax=Ditylenchus destructor TaxID=166010 RepID=A0AAD4MSP4_9BILA|nr:hypothetical protein DdX_14794 [Ditylenchus destructor]